MDTEEQRQEQESVNLKTWKDRTLSEGRLGAMRMHARETRASESGEQREAETDCSTSQCYVGPWTYVDIICPCYCVFFTHTNSN